MRRRKNDARAKMDALIVKCQVLRLKGRDAEAERVLAQIEAIGEEIEALGRAE